MCVYWFSRPLHYCSPLEGDDEFPLLPYLSFISFKLNRKHCSSLIKILFCQHKEKKMWLHKYCLRLNVSSYTLTADTQWCFCRWSHPIENCRKCKFFRRATSFKEGNPKSSDLSMSNICWGKTEGRWQKENGMEHSEKGQDCLYFCHPA